MPPDNSFFAQNDDQLYAFGYKSIPTTEPSMLTLDALLKVSRHNNQAVNLTGMLLYTDGLFFQYLEGSKETIQALYIRLLNDKRHHTVTTLMDEPIDKRLFKDWAMKLEICDLTKEFVAHLSWFEEGHQEYALRYIDYTIAKKIIAFYASQNIASEIIDKFNTDNIIEKNPKK